MTNKVEAKTFTVLDDSEFVDGKPMFYCSYENEHKNDTSKKYDSKFYSGDVNSSDHQFVFSSDFTTPINYKYSTEGYLGFGVRDINKQIESCEKYNGMNELSEGKANCVNDPKVCKSQKDYCYRDSDDVCGQIHPAIAVNRTTGSMVAVWEDDTSCEDGKGTEGERKGKVNHDIEGRIFYGGGCEKVSQFRIHKDKSGDQKTPVTAMDIKGNFVVVWADDSDGDGDYDIWMRGFDENGKERIPQTHVNSIMKGQQSNPSIAMAADGRFVVAWEDEADGKALVKMRGFKADGAQAFAEINVSSNKNDVQGNPSLGMDDNGNIVVAWENRSTGKGDIWVKGFDMNGTTRFESFVANTDVNGMQRNPAVAMNSKGFIYVAYEDDSDEDGRYRIKGRSFKADGTPLNDSTVYQNSIQKELQESATNPVVCISQDNDVVITWELTQFDWYSDTNEWKNANHNILRISENSNGVLGKVHRVNSIDRGRQTYPAMGCTQDGRSVILWQDDMHYKNYHNIYGRGFNEL